MSPSLKVSRYRGSYLFQQVIDLKAGADKKNTQKKPRPNNANGFLSFFSFFFLHIAFFF